MAGVKQSVAEMQTCELVPMNRGLWTGCQCPAVQGGGERECTSPAGHYCEHNAVTCTGKPEVCGARAAWHHILSSWLPSWARFAGLFQLDFWYRSSTLGLNSHIAPVNSQFRGTVTGHAMSGPPPPLRLPGRTGSSQVTELEHSTGMPITVQVQVGCSAIG